MLGSRPQDARSPRRRVLIVDDERAIRGLVHRALARADFEVLEAANGRDAIELLHAASFDLVVTDVLMPVMGGLELLRHLRAEHPALPVVIVSGHFDPMGQSITDLGAFAVLTKPFSIEHLQRTALNAVLSLEGAPTADQGCIPPTGSSRRL